MKVDYIIVGQGFAGSFFVWQCIKNKKTFVIISEDKQSASYIASGIYNPVVLKRFTPIWDGLEQIKALRYTMQEIENFFQVKLHEEIPILRIIDNEQEQKTWRKKARNKLSEILENELIENFPNIKTPYGLGKVHHTGRVFTKLFLETIKNYCIQKNIYFKEKFFYSELKINDNGLVYKNILANHIVFCEGINVLQNPYFSHIPIKSNKGESLVVKLGATLNKEYIFKKKYFLFHENNDNYFIGGTNDSIDTSLEPTVKMKQVMLNATSEITDTNYHVLAHQAALRSTTLDYRPIVGTHRHYNNLHVMNGMGTRGVLLANFAAEILVNKIERNTLIPNEVDCNRSFNGHIYE